MNDPYKVLGVSQSSTDEEIKKAYRDLARKYHPDNYIDNPLADLAQEKMKEINEAYDIITKQRASGGQASGGQQASGGSGGYRQYSSGRAEYTGTHSNPVYAEVRRLIQLGNIAEAESRLVMIGIRDAEWNFLMGCIYQRKGWYDDARRHYQTACSLAPGNLEYREGYARLNNMNTAYRSVFGDAPTLCDICSTLICANCLCNICCGR